MARYVIFPTPEGTRRISLSCAIRPGAMTDRYSVTWKQILPFGSPHLLSANTQNITVDVNSTNATISTYQCNVIIQHSSDVSVSYFPPPVTIVNNTTACHMLIILIFWGKAWNREATCFSLFLCNYESVAISQQLYHQYVATIGLQIGPLTCAMIYGSMSLHCLLVCVCHNRYINALYVCFPSDLILLCLCYFLTHELLLLFTLKMQYYQHWLGRLKMWQ